ncbi:putative pumilio [Cardamine amara subsp. amara]|uniref:Pumilio n=1 Tax=Cardamine amara subsp. amara TaxID=228776 RepID=A0ABD0ZP81_CARAN
MLYELTLNNAVELAKLENGCTAVNMVFEEIKGKYRDLIFERVAENAKWLSFDPYGTYVVQNFLTLHNPNATKAIAERLGGNFFSLAMCKEGSYVVEKCLNSDFARLKVLEEFRGNDKEWVRMAKHKFGNYVAQCALNVMKERGMIPLLREFLGKLRPHLYGNKILQMIQNKFGGWLDHSPVDDLRKF